LKYRPEPSLRGVWRCVAGWVKAEGGDGRFPPPDSHHGFLRMVKHRLGFRPVQSIVTDPGELSGGTGKCVERAD
jgi:hypothetical protein